MIASFHLHPQYKKQAAGLFADLISATNSSCRWEDRIISWATMRLRTAGVTTVLKYISQINAILKAEEHLDISHSSTLQAFTRALRKLSGEHRNFPTPPMTHQHFIQICSQLPSPYNMIVILCWHRAGRIMDILETRQGGLWRGMLDPTTQHSIPPHLTPLILEEPWDKVGWAGLSNSTQILVSSLELATLTPIISLNPPSTPPRMRPLLFPGITTPMMSQ